MLTFAYIIPRKTQYVICSPIYLEMTATYLFGCKQESSEMLTATKKGPFFLRYPAYIGDIPTKCGHG